MEITNGVGGDERGSNSQVIKKSAELQYEESHVLKKRKLLLSESEEEEMITTTSTLRIASSTTQYSQITGPNFSVIDPMPPVSLYSRMSSMEFLGSCQEMTRKSGYFGENDSADIMGNPLPSDKEESEDTKPSEKDKKKKKKKRHRDRERKKELIDVDDSSEDSKKSKEPRIGTQYQCDMSVLNNREGDRIEFVGEKIWDPTNIDFNTVETFLQEIKSSRPILNQFEFEPFFEYIPANSIISQDKLLRLLMKFNYSFEKTKKYLADQKLEYTDRGFAVRQTWKTGEIKAFEKALKYMFEEEGEFDLEDVKRAMPSKPMNQICEFYYAWKHTKRFQAWKEETTYVQASDHKRKLSMLRSVARVDYNDQTAIVLSNLNNINRPPKYKKPLDDSKVVSASTEGGYVVYEIIINAQIYDPDLDRINCAKYITKRNTKTDKYLLEYS